MDKKPEFSKADVGILASGILLLVVGFCHLLSSDIAKQPGLLRNIRLVLDILLENHLEAWTAWYTGNFVAKLLVWLLTAIPAVTLVVSVFVKLGWSSWLPNLQTVFNMDTDTAEKPPVASSAPEEPRPAPESYPAEAKNHQRAMERLEVLHDLCGHTPSVMKEPCVRVQMLSGDPKQRIDQILEWFGPPDSYYASIRVSPQYEILLTLNEEGIPSIVGLCDMGEEDVPDWQENLYPLDPEGVPTVLMRPSGQGTVNRYAITWLGGNHV